MRAEHELEVLPLEPGPGSAGFRLRGFGVEHGQHARQMRAQRPSDPSATSGGVYGRARIRNTRSESIRGAAVGVAVHTLTASIPFSVGR